MKTIVLMPIRNELAMLQYNLPNILLWADHVIIADQHSTDGTRDLYKKYPEVTVVDNNHQGHSNEVYWQLLKEARRFGDKNIIFYIDADEWVPADLMKQELAKQDYVPGMQIDMQWIHPWKSFEQYRTDGIYRKLTKRVGWIDNGQYQHDHTYVIHGHTSIIPNCDGPVICLQTPLIHLQFLAFERLQWKQAWYRCGEHIAKAFSPQRINNKYRHTLEHYGIKLSPMPAKWKESAGVIPESVFETVSLWQRTTVLNWIDEYGLEFFEPLQIWHIEELRQKFIREIGREPRPLTYPNWLVFANDQKNHLKYWWIRQKEKFLNKK